MIKLYWGFKDSSLKRYQNNIIRTEGFDYRFLELNSTDLINPWTMPIYQRRHGQRQMTIDFQFGDLATAREAAERFYLIGNIKLERTIKGIDEPFILDTVVENISWSEWESNNTFQLSLQAAPTWIHLYEHTYNKADTDPMPILVERRKAFGRGNWRLELSLPSGVPSQYTEKAEFTFGDFGFRWNQPMPVLTSGQSARFVFDTRNMQESGWQVQSGGFAWYVKYPLARYPQALTITNEKKMLFDNGEEYRNFKWKLSSNPDWYMNYNFIVEENII